MSYAHDSLKPPPGLLCPACQQAELRLKLNRNRPSLTCRHCGVLVRLLRRHGDPEPALDMDDQQADVPPAGAWWLAYVRGADGILRPVALAPTLGGAWDGVLSCPLRGVIVVAPTDPPRWHREDLPRVA